MFCRRRIFTFAFPYIQGPRQRQAGLYMTNLQRILTLDRLGQRQCWDSQCPLVFLPALLRHRRHELVGATHSAGGVVVVVNVGQTHVLSETFPFILFSRRPIGVGFPGVLLRHASGHCLGGPDLCHVIRRKRRVLTQKYTKNHFPR